jgi:hypothetical protein
VHPASKRRFAHPQIVVEDLPSPQQVSAQIRHQRIRQHRDTIFRPLALTNQNLALLEIRSFTRKRTHSIRRIPVP